MFTLIARNRNLVGKTFSWFLLFTISFLILAKFCFSSLTMVSLNICSNLKFGAKKGNFPKYKIISLLLLLLLFFFFLIKQIIFQWILSFISYFFSLDCKVAQVGLKSTTHDLFPWKGFICLMTSSEGRTFSPQNSQ